MKKRFIVFIVAAIMLLCTTAFCVVGCGTGGGDSEAPKIEYNITVLAPNGDPVKDVLVSWQQAGKTKGSAHTDENGFATVQIAEDTYDIVLSGVGEGLTYPAVSITSDMRVGACITLTVMRVTYTAEVKDKTGAAASGVVVSWEKGGKIETATTGADGKASCELDYGSYTVDISNLPAGNIYDADPKTVTGASPQAIFELRDGVSVEFTVTVRSAGGLKFAGMTVYLYKDNVSKGLGTTDKDGVVKFSQVPGSYTARVSYDSIPEGYKITKTATLATLNRQSEIVLTSSVRTGEAPDVKDKNFKAYKIGDIIHDYEWTTPYEVDGKKKTYSIAELLETKDAVIINNWGTGCSNCVLEMPHMQTVYEKYQDKIEMLAINNYPSNYGYDSDDAIISYRDRNAYTIPMMRDTNSFATRFDITGWPTTIIVDRYGAIARVEKGIIPYEDVWDRMIAPYVSDDYTQTFTPGKDNMSITEEVSKPDVTVPDDHYEKVAEKINNFTATDNMYVEWFGETKNEMIWPFILKTEDGVSEEKEVLCSSNVGKPNSMSAIYAKVKMPVGKVLTVDYYSDTETGRDILSALWDGKIVVNQMSGDSKGWKTAYLYTELTDDEHYLTLAYVKDTSSDIGLDNVYIKNVRFEDVSAMTGSADMLRQAAYGAQKDNSTEYTHYAKVEVADDGYYHVKRDELENSQYAGVDPSPMLFANLMDATNWSGYSVSELIYLRDEEGRYVFACTTTKDGKEYEYRDDLIEYCRIAAASDVYGYLPVDEELCAVLKAFTAEMEEAEKISPNANAWLNLCAFYSHYGDDDEFIGNPIIGLTPKTAIVAEAGNKIAADCTRTMAPFPTLIYSFTPTASAVYKIESLLPADSNQAAQVWLYDDDGDPDHALVHSGDERFVRDGVNEHNFVVYRYLEANHKYYIEVAFLMQEMGTLDFKVTAAGESTTELVPCSSSMFNAILGPDGESIVGVELAGAVSYYKDDDGYYRVGDENDKHDDDPFIYLDLKYDTSVSMSFTDLADQYVKIPFQDEYCDFMAFDFSKRIAYSYQRNGSEEPTLLGYIVDYDLTEANHGIANRDYKDYTDMVNDLIEQSAATDGLVKVNDEIKDMLILFIETRVNPLNVYDNGTIEYDAALDNEWLRLCWYYYTHNADNP